MRSKSAGPVGGPLGGPLGGPVGGLNSTGGPRNAGKSLPNPPPKAPGRGLNGPPKGGKRGTPKPGKPPNLGNWPSTPV